MDLSVLSTAYRVTSGRRERETETDRDRQTETDRQRQTDRHGQGERDRHGQRDRQTESVTERCLDGGPVMSQSSTKHFLITKCQSALDALVEDHVPLKLVVLV